MTRRRKDLVAENKVLRDRLSAITQCIEKHDILSKLKGEGWGQEAEDLGDLLKSPRKKEGS